MVIAYTVMAYVVMAHLVLGHRWAALPCWSFFEYRPRLRNINAVGDGRYLKPQVLVI